jgi:MerR family mercuric resistance operon transcriptional regulator
MYVPGYGVKSIMKSMTIGQLAAAAWVNVETVRYYQRRELLSTPEREAGSIGRYPQAALARLRFIKRSQSLGFSLDDVQVLLSLDDGQACSSARHLGELKLAEVRDRIQTLRVLEVALQGLVSKCATAKRKVSCPLIDALTRAEEPTVGI